MAKEAFYFSHDYGARNDPKLQKVLMRLGQEGKGVYWDLIEMLFEEGGKLLLSEIESYTFALRTNNECIMKLLNDFGLFEKNDEYFWSNSVNRRLEKRNEKSEKARLSVKKRWENTNVSKNDTFVIQSHTKRNTIKERKGKESIYGGFLFFKDGFIDVWQNFKDMRAKIKKPLTPHAEILNLNELSELSKDDFDLAIKIVNQSIKYSWQGFFPLKANYKQQSVDYSNVGN